MATLRLVHPPGQEAPRPKGRRRPAPALSLSAEERRHLAQALKTLHLRLGSWSCVAEVTGIPVHTLVRAANRRRGASAILAIRVAKAAGSTVEVILSGRIGPVTTCPTCGSTAADRRAS